MNNKEIEGSVRKWVETLVVELNLCPFAQRQLTDNKVRFAVSSAATDEQLLADLEAELALLQSDATVETTLLIHPNVLTDFEDYNQFLNAGDELLAAINLEGVYQIASFHPHYRFDGTGVNDAENYTNRSPYPMLHLIREDSLARVIANTPDVGEIPTRNIALMNSLGTDRLQALMQACLE